MNWKMLLTSLKFLTLHSNKQEPHVIPASVRNYEPIDFSNQYFHSFKRKVSNFFFILSFFYSNCQFRQDRESGGVKNLILKNIVSGLQNMEENIHQNKRRAKHYLGDIMADNLIWRKTGAVTAL